MKKFEFKLPAFSMLEACITMLIVGVFTAMCASAFTKRNITYQESDGHGRFECYRNGTQVIGRYVENNSARAVTTSGGKCVFRPPRYAKYLLISMTGGGSGSAAGQFANIFYSSVDAPLTITPGGAGGSSNITMNGKNLLTVSGGGGAMVATDTAANSISECKFASTAYNCGSDATCVQDGTELVISYCASPDAIDYVTNRITLENIKKYRASFSGDTIVYKDLQVYKNNGINEDDALTMIDSGIYGSNYTLNIKFNMTTSQKSLMETYLMALGLPENEGIRMIQPGSKGKPGGVIVLW